MIWRSARLCRFTSALLKQSARISRTRAGSASASLLQSASRISSHCDHCSSSQRLTALARRSALGAPVATNALWALAPADLPQARSGSVAHTVSRWGVATGCNRGVCIDVHAMIPAMATTRTATPARAGQRCALARRSAASNASIDSYRFSGSRLKPRTRILRTARGTFVLVGPGATSPARTAASRLA